MNHFSFLVTHISSSWEQVRINTKNVKTGAFLRCYSVKSECKLCSKHFKAMTIVKKSLYREANTQSYSGYFEISLRQPHVLIILKMNSLY